MKKLLLALVIVMTPLTGLAVSPVGNGDRPLLMAGKHSLYQRVLSVPGARIASEPGGQAHTAVVPFTAFYVYARREQGGSAWLELVRIATAAARAGCLLPIVSSGTMG